MARKEDFGVNDRTFIVNTHLGEILNFNDTVLGYDLIQSNTSDLEEHAKVDKYLPEIVLVKKTYPKFRKRQRNRFWKLKHFEDNKQENQEMQEEDPEDEAVKPTQEKKKSKKQLKRDARQERDIRKEKDYELFLQDIEDDPEFRASVNLYKNDDIIRQLEAKVNSMSLNDMPSTLKDDLDKGVSKTTGQEREVKTAVRKTAIGKAIQHQSEKQRQQSQQFIKANMKTIEEKGDGDSEWESAEEDAPAIKLEELLDNLKIDDAPEEEKTE